MYLTRWQGNPNDQMRFSALIDRISKQIPPNPMIDRMGGDVVTSALRYYIIALIKHLGLLPSVMKSEVLPPTDKLLVKIWMESRKIRQWIGGERRRISDKLDRKQIMSSSF